MKTLAPAQVRGGSLPFSCIARDTASILYDSGDECIEIEQSLFTERTLSLAIEPAPRRETCSFMKQRAVWPGRTREGVAHYVHTHTLWNLTADPPPVLLLLPVVPAHVGTRFVACLSLG